MAIDDGREFASSSADDSMTEAVGVPQHPTPEARPLTPNTHHSPSMHIVSMLGGYRARIRRQRKARYLCMAALGIGVAWLVAALAHYFDLPIPGTLPVAAALTILLPVAALAWEAARKPSLPQTAAIVDKRLDNHQRLLTSVELLTRGDTAPLTQAQLETSAAALSRVRPKTLYPIRTPWNLAASGAGLLLVAVGLFMLKGGGFSPFTAGALPPDQPVVSSLAAPTPDAGLPPSERTPEPTPTPKPEEVALDSEGQQPQEGDQQQQQQEGNNPSGPTDPKEQAAASQQAESDLARLGRALDGQSVTQQAADALKQGNEDEAAKQLTELGKENDQVSDAAKEGLADALEQAAQETDRNPILQQAEEEAAKALRNGDYADIDEAMQNLAKAMQQTAANVVPQQELAKGFPEQPTEATQTPSEQDASGADQSGQQDGTEGDKQGDEQGDKSAQDGSQDGAGDMGGQQGEGDKGESGQGGGQQPSEGGEGDSSGGAPGQGTRVDGPKDPTDLDVAGNPFELEAQPDPGNTKPQSDDGRQRPGLTLDGGSGGGGASPVSPGNAVNMPSETGNLPLDRWEVIRKFFTPAK